MFWFLTKIFAGKKFLGCLTKFRAWFSTWQPFHAGICVISHTSLRQQRRFGFLTNCFLNSYHQQLDCSTRLLTSLPALSLLCSCAPSPPPQILYQRVRNVLDSCTWQIGTAIHIHSLHLSSASFTNSLYLSLPLHLSSYRPVWLALFQELPKCFSWHQ